MSTFLLSISILIICFTLAVMNKELFRLNKRVNELDTAMKTYQKILSELNYEIKAAERKLTQQKRSREIDRS